MSLLEIAGHHHIGNSSPIFCLTSSLFPQTVQTSKTDETKFLSALPFAPPKLLATILQDFNRCSALVRGRVRYKPTYWNNPTVMWDRKLLISGNILLKMILLFLSPTRSLITFFHCLPKTKTCEDWNCHSLMTCNLWPIYQCSMMPNDQHNMKYPIIQPSNGYRNTMHWSILFVFVQEKR